MLSVQIRGSELAKVIRNAQLWQEEGVSLTNGRALLSFGRNELTLYSTDGYTAMKDEIEYNEPTTMAHDDYVFYWFTEDQMDSFLMMAVDAKTGPLRIEFDLVEGVKLPYDITPEDKDNKTKKVLKEGSVFFGEPSDLPEWCQALEEALELAELPESGDLQFETQIAMRPERLVKFFRVRTDKEAPVDFRFMTPWNPKGGPMAAVKIGFTFRALINFVNRDVAKMNLTEEQQVFMWK